MKKNSIRISIFLSLLLVASSVLAACGSSNQQAASNILRARIYEDIKCLDPAFIVNANDDTVSRAVMEGLVRFVPNSTELQNVLAETYSISPDGLEITFKLREGIQWHRGYGELTTEDVKFSYERFIDPELAAAYADDFASLDHVEIISKYEGKIFLKEPQATLWTTTLPLTSGSIICKKYYEEVGKEAFATNIIGTGPYTFEEWKPMERVTLKANPDYWGDKPALDEIQLIPITEDSASEVALEAGEIDFGMISLPSADRFEDNKDFAVMIVPTNQYGWIGMNVENPKLEDINVREAIRYGIDVPSILEVAYAGKAEQARAILPPRSVGYWADAPLYQRDVAKAKEYMAKAGLESLDLTLTIENSADYRAWAEIAQQNLAEIGINITINALDSSAFWVAGEGDVGKELELFTMQFSAMSDPAWFTMWFTSDQVGVWNWMRWASPEYDALHKKGLATLDPKERESIYIELQKLWDEAVNVVWVTHQPLAYAHSPKIKPVMDSNGKIPMLRDFTLVA